MTRSAFVDLHFLADKIAAGEPLPADAAQRLRDAAGELGNGSDLDALRDALAALLRDLEMRADAAGTPYVECGRSVYADAKLALSREATS